MDKQAAAFLLSKLCFTSSTTLSKELQYMQVLSASETPKVTLQSYLARFINHLGVSSTTLQMACVLVERACGCCGLILTPLNIHRVILGSLVVSSKFLYDDFSQQGTFAVAGGVRIHDLASIETAWLRVLDFDIWADPIELTLIQDKMLKAPIALCDLDLDMIANSLKASREQEPIHKKTQKTTRSPQSIPVDLRNLASNTRAMCGSFLLSI